jgi:hypothetical protein
MIDARCNLPLEVVVKFSLGDTGNRSKNTIGTTRKRVEGISAN